MNKIFFNPIAIEDKDLFNHYLRQRKSELVTFNFSNLFIWRDWDPFSWTVIEDCLCVRSNHPKWDAVMMPYAADMDRVFAATEQLIDWYAARNVPFLMSEITEETKELFETRYPGRFSFREFPEGFNYIYRQEDLATLKGRKYTHKRNHVNAFLRENPDFSFVELSGEWLDSCRENYRVWAETHDMESYDLIHEQMGVMNALDNWDKLDCRGMCLVIDGHVQGFTIGEELNDEIFAVHIEKGNPNIRGIFQVINQAFARDYAADCLYVNRAEDMGHPGQRKAKMSYHPCWLAKKYHMMLAE